MQNSICLFVAVVFIVGCATAPRVDWQGRIGKYTYEQAVTELGPAAKVMNLGEGRREAQWLIEPGTLWVTNPSLDARYASPQYTDPGPRRDVPPRYLHLIFGPDGKLAAWGEDRRTPDPLLRGA